MLDNMFNDDTRCKIITNMHSVWTSKNNWTHDRDEYDPVQAIKWVHETLTLLDLPIGRSKHLADQCWRPPDPGWITINTDGATNGDAMKEDAGGVVRSHLGSLHGVKLCL